MQKYTLYLGLNDKDTKKQEIATIEAYKITTNLLTSYTDGATIFEANGIYKHNDGNITIEKTLKIELLVSQTMLLILKTISAIAVYQLNVLMKFSMIKNTQEKSLEMLISKSSLELLNSKMLDLDILLKKKF